MFKIDGKSIKKVDKAVELGRRYLAEGRSVVFALWSTGEAYIHGDQDDLSPR